MKCFCLEKAIGVVLLLIIRPLDTHFISGTGLPSTKQLMVAFRPGDEKMTSLIILINGLQAKSRNWISSHIFPYSLAGSWQDVGRLYNFLCTINSRNLWSLQSHSHGLEWSFRVFNELRDRKVSCWTVLKKKKNKVVNLWGRKNCNFHSVISLLKRFSKV